MTEKGVGTSKGAFTSCVSDIRQAMIVQQERMAAASERLVRSLIGEVFG